MKSLFNKLNNRRGASIMLALLLFLVCALAGAAAVTAAGSNVGRYSYVEEDRQQFLTVTSAAKLIRDELNGLSLEATYTYTLTEDDFEVVPLDLLEPPPHTSHKVQPKAGAGSFEDDSFIFKHGETVIEQSDIDNNFLKFFKDALESINKSYFKYDISRSGSDFEKHLWASDDVKNYSVGNFGKSYTFKIEGEDFEEVTATVTLPDPDKETTALGEVSNYNEKKIKLVLEIDKIKYQADGIIRIKGEPHKEHAKQLPRDCEACKAEIPEIPSTAIGEYILKCSQKTTVEFDFADSVFTRVDEEETSS